MDKELMNRRIESQMVLKGISKETLADYLGCNYDTTRKKLAGESSWKDTEIILLARLFEVSTDYLLKGE